MNVLRNLVYLASATMLVGFGAAEAQQPTKIPRIGYVSGTGNSTDQGPYVEALRQGLRDLGHVEGRSFVIEFRGAEGKLDRIPALVNDLAKENVDLLVLPLGSSIRAAKQSTKTFPIVTVYGGDPVADRLVAMGRSHSRKSEIVAALPQPDSAARQKHSFRNWQERLTHLLGSLGIQSRSGTHPN